MEEIHYSAPAYREAPLALFSLAAGVPETAQNQGRQLEPQALVVEEEARLEPVLVALVRPLYQVEIPEM